MKPYVTLIFLCVFQLGIGLLAQAQIKSIVLVKGQKQPVITYASPFESATHASARQAAECELFLLYRAGTSACAGSQLNDSFVNGVGVSGIGCNINEVGGPIAVELSDAAGSFIQATTLTTAPSTGEALYRIAALPGFEKVYLPINLPTGINYKIRFRVTSTGEISDEAGPYTLYTVPSATLTNDGPLSLIQPKVTLTATEIAGATYVFSSGSTAGSYPNTATVSSPGYYSVTVTAANGCTASAQTIVEPPAGRVRSFELINAATDQVIKTLTEGELINLGSLPTSQLSIRAVTSPGPVGSVVFSLSGSMTFSKTEATSPYSLFGDKNGDYDPWNLKVGLYTLTATPYLGDGGTGQVGMPLVQRFQIINQPANSAVISYSLMNADTDQPIKLLTNNEVLNLALLPPNLNIRVNTSPATVGSVEMSLHGRQTRTQIEADAPYALFGDLNGSYNDWIPRVGNYTLTATPVYGVGTPRGVGTPLTISFQVVDQAPLARMGDKADAEAVLVYPNPFTESFTLKSHSKSPVILYDLSGRKVFELNAVQDEQVVQLGQKLAPGMYLLQIGQGLGVQRLKLMKIP